VVDEEKNEIVNTSINISTISEFSLEEDTWGTCVITITVRDLAGNITDSKMYFRIDANQSDCNAKGNQLAIELTPHISNGKIPVLMK